jgi:hypothetical protein
MHRIVTYHLPFRRNWNPGGYQPAALEDGSSRPWREDRTNICPPPLLISHTDAADLVSSAPKRSLQAECPIARLASVHPSLRGVTMTAPEAPSRAGSLAPHLSLSSCTPQRGPRRRPVIAVQVDDELVWVAPAPTLACGTARSSSPAALVHLHLQLAQEHAASRNEPPEAALAEADVIAAAARAVAGYLDDLPDLPLLGEPFGGEEGTD